MGKYREEETMNTAVDIALDLVKYASKGGLIAGAGHWAWMSQLGWLGKAGFAVGVVNPPAAIGLTAGGLASAGFAAARMRKTNRRKRR